MKVKVAIIAKFWKLLLCMGCLFLSVACQQRQGPSTIVIAVDRLPFQSANCANEPSQASGIQVLCQNSVRFTHGYSTSTMAAPAMASLLTGYYPIEHGLRHNADYLRAEFTMASELAAKAGYRTGFFSGGAPAIARTGLNQGFENFDESISISDGSTYRKFGRSIESFTNWLKSDVGSDPFFAVFYVPDLNFVDTETATEVGEVRNQSYESQLEEFDTKLFSLIQTLKKNAIWENARIVLVGLSGEGGSERPDEFANINLHSENTQISLFIKPSQKSRDTGIKWTVDTNVSISDVGQTLITWFGGKNSSNLPLPTYSLDGLLSEKASAIPEDRKILLESSWASWKKVGNERYAVVDGQWFFLFDSQPKLFNTLTDRLELNPITFEQNEVLTKMKLFLYRLNLNRFAPIDFGIAEFMKIPYQNWTLSSRVPQLKEALNKVLRLKNIKPWIVESTMAKAIELEDWAWLKQVASRFKYSDYDALASSYLSHKIPVFQNECLRVVKSPSDTSLLRACTDPYFIDFYNLMSLGDNVSDFQKRKTQRNWNFILEKRKIAMKDLALGQIWDLSDSLGTLYTPSEILVKLPSSKKWVQSFLNIKSESK